MTPKKPPASGEKRKTKGFGLALVSLLAWIAPFCVNLWLYGFFFVTPVHAFVTLACLIKLCGKDGTRQFFLWLALALSISYLAAFCHAIGNYKYGPGP
ncbi:hypothetical protein JIN84_00260 [Luteolibacter yonseiensis]|uniref:Uncharacterized protein n=1 Tax=Luteolibacter yonseiensis TaxID=1144680 RepID=A0A934R2F8_9BACT|nr:hypothetical protein [Luteolibacter yonseiensis]MBK1814039.1 hypothetical protein [Luteolibacter yonseiensis]